MGSHIVLLKPYKKGKNYYSQEHANGSRLKISRFKSRDYNQTYVKDHYYMADLRYQIITAPWKYKQSQTPEKKHGQYRCVKNYSVFKCQGKGEPCQKGYA